MKVQIYVLGFLMKFGPQHGYRLRQLISEKASDFAHIKTPTIYYHLEKMKAQGFVTSTEEQEGNRPERSVYKITEAGIREFNDMLVNLLQSKYDVDFPFDAAIFFSESIDSEILSKALSKRITIAEEILSNLKKHQQELMDELSEKPQSQNNAHAILNHHICHLEAEIKWLKETSYNF